MQLHMAYTAMKPRPACVPCVTCRVRAESRRVSASLQTVTRERDAARTELAEASAQLVAMAALRAELQRTEAALAEAEAGREEARAAAATVATQQTKLKAQLVRSEPLGTLYNHS